MRTKYEMASIIEQLEEENDRLNAALDFADKCDEIDRDIIRMLHVYNESLTSGIQKVVCEIDCRNESGPEGDGFLEYLAATLRDLIAQEDGGKSLSIN